MNSSRDDLIDRMKTGWGRFVLASEGGGIFTAAFHLSFTFSAEEVIGAKSVFTSTN
jgi:hypothetical protein